MEADPRLPLHPRRPDGRGRRLPGGPARSSATASPRWSRPAGWRSGRGRSCSTSSCARARTSCATWTRHAPAPTSSAGAMPVGYLPDMFGHTAQMPQILPRPGCGTPASGAACRRPWTADAFAWAAPDGTAIRTQYLPRAATATPRRPVRGPGGSSPSAAGRVHRAMRRWHGPEGPLLAMYGTDHSAPCAGCPDGGRARRPHGHARPDTSRPTGRRGRAAPGRGRAALARPRQHPARRHLRARPRSSRPWAGPSGWSSATPSRWPRSGAATGPAGSSTWPGGGWSTPAATTR